MLKTKFKLLTILAIFILLLSSFSFATEVNTSSNEENPIVISTPIENGADTNTQEHSHETINGDIYINNKKNYTLDKAINGNVFISGKDFKINPNDEGGIIQGNLFVTASTVTLESDTSYSSTNKDEEGNPSIEAINAASVIYGNLFVVANKLIIEPGCEINQDLFVIANEIEIAPNAIIYGSVYTTSSNLKLNGLIGGDLYAVTKSFEMNYHGFINRDLHLATNTAVINGVLYNNSFITAKTIITKTDFVNHGNLEVADASKTIVLGEVKGNADINSKELYIITPNNMEENTSVLNKANSISSNFTESIETTDSFTTIIGGNLNYSSKKEVTIDEGVVSGEINYSKYSSMPSFKEDILPCLISLFTLLVYVLVIYFVMKKLMPVCVEKFSEMYNLKKSLLAIGIGIGLIIVVPLAILLLALSKIGITLGILLAFVYAVMVILGVPIILITKSEFLRTKLLNDKINSYLSLVITTVIFWLITLIPYAGPIIAFLVVVAGTGELVLNCMNSKKE